jgi:RNA-directed DNA polymerase
MFSGRILNKHKVIHAYHKDFKELEEYISNQRDKNRKKHKTLKEKLFTVQKGVCSVCFEIMKENEEIHIHHILPISLGGSKNSIKNLTLVHKDCHIEHHSLNGE